MSSELKLLQKVQNKKAQKSLQHTDEIVTDTEKQCVSD